MHDSPAGARPALLATLRELPRPVVILLVGVAVNRLGNLVQIFLVLFVTHLGFSAPGAGLALTVYGFGAIVGVFASGTLSDAISPRRTIIVSMVASAGLVAALGTVREFAVLVVLSGCVGAVSQLYRPAALAMLAELTPHDRLVVTTAAYRLGLNVGAAAAPLLGVLLIHGSYLPVFLADAGTSLLFAVVATLLLPDVRPAGPEPAAGEVAPSAGYRLLLLDRRFLVVLVAMLATALAEIQAQSVLPLQIAARDLPTALYAVVLAINGALVIAIELPLTPLVAKLPMRLVMAAGTALIGFGIALFGLPAGAWLFVVGAVVWTFGEIISAPSTAAYPALVARPGMRGRYIGALSTFQALGYATGPLLGTALFQHVGSATWLLCAGLAVVAGTGFWVGVQTYHPRHARALIPGHHRTQSKKRGPGQHPRIEAHYDPPANPAEPDTDAPKHRGLIALSLAEIRKVLSVRRRHNHNRDESAAKAHALRWSNWRREHQTQGRRCHFQRRPAGRPVYETARNDLTGERRRRRATQPTYFHAGVGVPSGDNEANPKIKPSRAWRSEPRVLG